MPCKIRNSGERSYIIIYCGSIVCQHLHSIPIRNSPDQYFACQLINSMSHLMSSRKSSSALCLTWSLASCSFSVVRMELEVGAFSCQWEREREEGGEDVVSLMRKEVHTLRLIVHLPDYEVMCPYILWTSHTNVYIYPSEDVEDKLLCMHYTLHYDLHSSGPLESEYTSTSQSQTLAPLATLSAQSLSLKNH